MLWMRFSLDGRPCFGTLDNGRIRLHEGDMFESPVPTDRFIDSADVQWLTPCQPGKFICMEQLSRGGGEAVAGHSGRTAVVSQGRKRIACPRRIDRGACGRGL